MAEDPLGSVYAFVERAYIRLQAADILSQCLDEGGLNPLQRLVEAYVLAGPPGLGALREILEEVGVRKKQLDDDRTQIFSKLDKELRDYGIILANQHTLQSLARLTPVTFLAFVRQQGLSDELQQLTCLQLLQDTLETLSALRKHQRLLEEGESYLEDWLWGVIYQATHQDWPESPMNHPLQKLSH